MRRRKTGPSANDMREVSEGKGSARDRAEVSGKRKRRRGRRKKK